MSLELIIGPMFSGKTTEMMRLITRLYDVTTPSQKKVLVLNSSIDTREEGSTPSSHSSWFIFHPNFTYIKTKKLSDINTDEYFIIGIDECQFFDDLLEFCKIQLDKGKHIFCAGLNGSYTQSKIGSALDIIPLCDDVKFLKASCRFCNFENRDKGKLLISSAAFTRRIGGSEDLISVNEEYHPVCRHHLK